MQKNTSESSICTLRMMKPVLYLSVFMAMILFAVSAPCAISDYVGTYSGTYSGDDNGSWIAVVESNGNIAFITWSNTLLEPDGTDTMSVDDNGNISGVTDNGAIFNAAIDLSGNVTGTWSNGGNSGSLIGDKCDEATLADLSGTYTGMISGDASGNFSIMLNFDGYVSGTASVDGENYTIEGGFEDQGNIILNILNRAGAIGTVTAEESVNGSWYSYIDNADGTFSNSEGAEGNGGGGSSGSSGCFIDILRK